MSTVSIVGCDSYARPDVETAVRQALDHLGGIGRFVRPGMRVVLKPNLLAAWAPDTATVTHSEIVAAVARLVQQAGGVVSAADSPGGPFGATLMKKVYAATGLEQVARETGLALNQDFGDTEVTHAAGKVLRRFRIIRAIAQADLVINLPKLKTHGQMVYTGAIKNMFGAIPGTDKIDYHLRMADHAVFADALIDIFLAARPALTLMDAVVAMEGNGPSAGTPRQLGLILAGEDAFALDYVALHVLNADPLGVPVMRAAAERGLCPAGLGKVEIVGRSVEEVCVTQFDMPAMGQMMAVVWSRGRLLDWLAERIKPRPVFDHNVCTGCGLCARHCPPKVIAMAGGKPRVDLQGCIRCFCCQELCSAKAVDIWRLSPPVASVMRIVFFVLSVLASRLHRLARRIYGKDSDQRG